MGKKPNIITDKLKNKIINNIWRLFWNWKRKKGRNKKHNESNGDKNRNLSLDKYLNEIDSYLRNIIINLQNSDTWKIQLTIAINFISSKDSEEERVIHSCSDKIKLKLTVM